MSGLAKTPPPRTHSSPPPVSINAASGVPYGHVPAYLPGCASLVEELDKKLMVVLRDGRHLIGVRRNNQFLCCARNGASTSWYFKANDTVDGIVLLLMLVRVVRLRFWGPVCFPCCKVEGRGGCVWLLSGDHGEMTEWLKRTFCTSTTFTFMQLHLPTLYSRPTSALVNANTQQRTFDRLINLAIWS